MPELLITETLAFHDRRLRDTDMEAADSPNDDGDNGVVEFRFPPANNNDQMKDNVQDIDGTLDQFRIPQGSLYLELYATGNPHRNNPVARRDLYNAADGSLNLGRVVTDDLRNESGLARRHRQGPTEPRSHDLERQRKGGTRTSHG